MSSTPPVTTDAAEIDQRHLEAGWVMASGGYFDQPYVVRTADGAWLCVVTTCPTREGAAGQRIVAARSLDRGRTWSPWVDIEPADGPLASWGMPYRAPSGRIYVFYTYNTSNLQRVITDPGYENLATRVDTLGDMMLKYSDDHGLTWSTRRYPVPIRPFAIDRENPYGGKIQFWWGVGKPIESQGAVYLGFSKVGRFGAGFMARSEGAFLRSDNLMTENNPDLLRWQTLPEGEIGLRPVLGDVADEHNLVPLSDGSLFCTYRTTAGHPCHAYSWDGGRTWTPPAHMTYGPGGRFVKHPRAANFVKRFRNGKYLYWYHNNGLGAYAFSARVLGANRNPVFLLGGEEREGHIHWSEPELVLYCPDMTEAMSYPDFIEEDDGRVYFTETQKTIARVHALEPRILQALWAPETILGPVPGATAELRQATARSLPSFPLPNLDLRENHRRPAGPTRRENGAFTLEFVVRFDSFDPHQRLLDGLRADGSGLAVTLTPRKTLRIELNDGRCASAWECDPGTLLVGRTHHVVVTVDGGPNLISWIIDGQFQDGGAHRDFGWGLVHPDLRLIPLPPSVALAPDLIGELALFRAYDRALLTAEARANQRAELGSVPVAGLAPAVAASA
jgi:hypothetical protein